MRWAGHATHMGEIGNAHKILVRKPERMRTLGRPRYGWEENITMNLREIVWEGVDWIHLSQDRNQWQTVVDMVMNLGFHNAGNFLTS
jgi:hypothetical protein